MNEPMQREMLNDNQLQQHPNGLLPNVARKVEIVQSEERKKYFGGYKNKLTGAIYEHAATQTPRVTMGEPMKDYSHLRTRDTQTYELQTRSQQTTRESGTQMSRPDLYVDERRDVVVAVKPYMSSYRVHAVRTKSVLLIQRYWRGYLARRKAWAMRRLIAEQQEEQMRQAALLEQHAQKERELKLQRRLNPRTTNDFTEMYDELDSWRRMETQKTKVEAADPLSRTQGFVDILQKETRVLHTIDKLKAEATRKLAQTKTETMLRKMAESNKWELSHGTAASVDTPEICRARELANMYHELTKSSHSIDERLELLLNVKWTVQEHDCTLTRDLVDLIDREADLLNRGRRYVFLTNFGLVSLSSALQRLCTHCGVLFAAWRV